MGHTVGVSVRHVFPVAFFTVDDESLVVVFDCEWQVTDTPRRDQPAVFNVLQTIEIAVTACHDGTTHLTQPVFSLHFVTFRSCSSAIL